MSDRSDDYLRLRFPMIEWDSPLPTRVEGGGDTDYLVCRYCVAHHGLKGIDVPKWPVKMEEFDEHLREVHGRQRSA